ncbi:MAG: TonB-dependent receptor [Muribaculaceae bacterium]|nr:TonB-dependent receptor [Muribaculaceae bacterium]
MKQMPVQTVLPVTRLGRAQVNELGIEAVKDIGDVVPNLYTPAYGSRMTSSIYMRGLGSRIDQAVVGLTVDGVPVMNKDAYDFDIPDIALVEVLRGAQSVLNGRNAMAGQINIHTLSPLTTRGWRASAQYGRNNDTRVNVGGYFGINDVLSASLCIDYGHSDGYFRNEYNHRRVGLENNGSARWKTVWHPTPALSLTNTAALGIARQSGYPYAQLGSDAIAYNDTCFYRRTSISDGVTLAWAGKRVVVTSLTSVQYLSDNVTLDQDFTSLDYFTLTQRRHEFTVTEDLFTKASRGNYAWLGGVFGYYRRSRMHAPVTFLDTGLRELIENRLTDINPGYPIIWDSRTFPLLSDFTTPWRGFSLYHQSSYTLGEWLFEAGLRWELESISCDYRSKADASYTIYEKKPDGTLDPYMQRKVDIDDNGHMKSTFNQLLPKIVVSRKWRNGHAYASFTKGYKSGGFNTQMFSDVLQQRVMALMGLTMAYKPKEVVSYKPEYSWNYEIGADWHNDRIGLETVVFFIDCHDQQLTMFPPGTVTGRIMTNAGRSRSFGVEFSGHWHITDDLSFNGTYGYTDARFRRYDNGRENFAGKRVPYAPAHTLFLQGLWTTPWRPAGLTTQLNLTLRGTGSIMWNDANTLSQPFYALAGGSFSFKAEKWSLKLWTENFTGTRYDTFYFQSMSRDFVQRGRPITYGATLRIHIN